MRDTKGTKFHNEAHSGPTMTGSCRLLVVALGALLSCMPLWHALPTAQTDTFRLLPNWWRLPADVATGSVTAAYPDVNGRVFVFRRAEPPILELEASGAFVRSFAADLIVSAHGIRLDSEGRIWVADVGGHAVYKLDRDGRVLLTLGKKGVKGNGPDTFNGPTDVLSTPQGDIFVTDGQFNSRIVRFRADGTFVKEWGTNGSGDGQMKLPHAIATDSAGHLFVADRDNARIVLFDRDGRFLANWAQFGAPSGLYITPDDTLYVAAIGEQSGVVIGSARSGEVRGRVAMPSKGVNGPHLISADGRGAIYVADLLSNEVKKLTAAP
jgi:sugar lactone lactonase YvrE